LPLARDDNAVKVLIISNFYPPHYVGGYELGCRDVVEGLKARGHTVDILTSTYGAGRPICEGGICRCLQLQSPGKRLLLSKLVELVQREIRNQRALERALRSSRPDLVYIWNLRFLSIMLARLAEDSGLPVCYFVSDPWICTWELDSWYSLWAGDSRPPAVRLAMPVLRPLLAPLGIIPSGSLELQHVQFASAYLKRAALEAHKPVTQAEVIHWGIDVDSFMYNKQRRKPERLLYVGQVAPHKGVRTAIEAVRTLIDEYRRTSLQLTVAGDDGGDVGVPGYLTEMRALAHSYGLESNVRFIGKVPREHLKEIYHDHDILLFPSTWAEPFSITLLEAMSCGLAVVGTQTGGSSEILQHEVNAQIFAPGDARACADQVLRLLNDQPLFEAIRQSGRRTVENSFRLQGMIDRVEQSLLKALRRERVCHSA
jgi:glycosyltransferase involved in cell wall biosynthesis